MLRPRMAQIALMETAEKDAGIIEQGSPFGVLGVCPPGRSVGRDLPALAGPPQ